MGEDGLSRLSRSEFFKLRHYRKGESMKRRGILAAFAMVLLLPGTSFGQASDSENTPEEASSPDPSALYLLDEMVVVGSRAEGRSVVDSPVPVDVVRAEDILQTGETEMGRVIQTLIPSFNFSSSTISDGTDSVRPATLRGMGPDQVLVLVNGRRRHGSALIHVNTSVGRHRGHRPERHSGRRGRAY